MSNREYYGDSTPNNLSSQDEPQQMNSPESSELHPAHEYKEYLKKYEAQIGNQFSQHSQREDFDPVAANEAPEGEKGLGATVFGGAGGAFVGHHVGKKSDHGTLGAVSGALAGALLANVASNAVKRSHHGRGSANDRRRERLERRLDRLG